MNERVDILAEPLFMESVYCMSRYTLNPGLQKFL